MMFGEDWKFPIVSGLCWGLLGASSSRLRRHNAVSAYSSLTLAGPGLLLGKLIIDNIEANATVKPCPLPNEGSVH